MSWKQEMRSGVPHEVCIIPGSDFVAPQSIEISQVSSDRRFQMLYYIGDELACSELSMKATSWEEARKEAWFTAQLYIEQKMAYWKHMFYHFIKMGSGGK